jgi:hypothetical protein
VPGGWSGLTVSKKRDPGAHREQIGARGRTWNREVRRLFHEVDLSVVRTPLQTPNADAFAERIVRSIEDELLELIEVASP